MKTINVQPQDAYVIANLLETVLYQSRNIGSKMNKVFMANTIAYTEATAEAVKRYLALFGDCYKNAEPGHGA